MSKKLISIILLVSLLANMVVCSFLYVSLTKENFVVGVDQGKRLTASTGISTSVVVPPESPQTGILVCSEDVGSTCMSLVYSANQIKNFFLSGSGESQWYFEFFDGNLDPETIQIQLIKGKDKKDYKLVAEYDQ